jgi:hypothetical protein
MLVGFYFLEEIYFQGVPLKNPELGLNDDRVPNLVGKQVDENFESFVWLLDHWFSFFDQ